uniref:GAR domain-containing protein n=1 Tax=Macrostomum lignano TaxID=282301 RepID=A0A1I8H5T5_9PLAT
AAAASADDLTTVKFVAERLVDLADAWEASAGAVAEAKIEQLQRLAQRWTELESEASAVGAILEAAESQLNSDTQQQQQQADIDVEILDATLDEDRRLLRRFTQAETRTVAVMEAVPAVQQAADEAEETIDLKALEDWLMELRSWAAGGSDRLGNRIGELGERGDKLRALRAGRNELATALRRAADLASRLEDLGSSADPRDLLAGASDLAEQLRQAEADLVNLTADFSSLGGGSDLLSTDVEALAALQRRSAELTSAAASAAEARDQFDSLAARTADFLNRQERRQGPLDTVDGVIQQLDDAADAEATCARDDKLLAEMARARGELLDPLETLAAAADPRASARCRQLTERWLAMESDAELKAKRSASVRDAVLDFLAGRRQLEDQLAELEALCGEGPEGESLEVKAAAARSLRQRVAETADQLAESERRLAGLRPHLSDSAGQEAAAKHSDIDRRLAQCSDKLENRMAELQRLSELSDSSAGRVAGLSDWARRAMARHSRWSDVRAAQVADIDGHHLAGIEREAADRVAELNGNLRQMVDEQLELLPDREARQLGEAFDSAAASVEHVADLTSRRRRLCGAWLAWTRARADARRELRRVAEQLRGADDESDELDSLTEAVRRARDAVEQFQGDGSQQESLAELMRVAEMRIRPDDDEEDERDDDGDLGGVRRALDEVSEIEQAVAAKRQACLDTRRELDELRMAEAELSEFLADVGRQLDELRVEPPTSEGAEAAAGKLAELSEAMSDRRSELESLKLAAARRQRSGSMSAAAASAADVASRAQDAWDDTAARLAEKQRLADSLAGTARAFEDRLAAAEELQSRLLSSAELDFVLDENAASPEAAAEAARRLRAAEEELASGGGRELDAAQRAVSQLCKDARALTHATFDESSPSDRLADIVDANRALADRLATRRRQLDRLAAVWEAAEQRRDELAA